MGWFLGGINAAIFIVGAEVAEIVGMRVRSVDDIFSQMINFAFRLGLAASVNLMH